MWTIAGPVNLYAQEAEKCTEARASMISSVKEFIKKDWEQTKLDMRNVGNKLGRIRSSLLFDGKISDDTWDAFTEKMMNASDEAMDEIGVHEFDTILKKELDGTIVKEKGKEASERLQRASLKKLILSKLETLRVAIEGMSRKRLKAALSSSEDVAHLMKQGKTLEETAKEISSVQNDSDANISSEDEWWREREPWTAMDSFKDNVVVV